MSVVDTTTKLSYLLPTGTFLTFQVLAPLATNNGKCGVTEKVLTGVTLMFLVVGCVFTSFTDSYTAPDGQVYNGFLTYKGLLVPGFKSAEMVGSAEEDGQVLPENANLDANLSKKAMKKQVKQNRNYIVGPMYVPLMTDYINATLAAVSFLTLTMFTDPVSSCFYPNMSETILKTLPVLLAAVLSFFCTFSAKIRHGYGNSMPKKPDKVYKPAAERGDHPASGRYLPAKDDSRITVNEVDDLHQETKHNNNKKESAI